MYSFFFFFSSRRRHTRFDCDWSSDVCSSDLKLGRFHPPDRQVLENISLSFYPGAKIDVLGSNGAGKRSEEHTSELQSQSNLVCRLLLEKKTIEPDMRFTQGKA